MSDKVRELTPGSLEADSEYKEVFGMKAVAMKRMRVDKVQAMAEYIIESVCSVIMDPEFGKCHCMGDGPCTCSARYEIVRASTDGIGYTPDHHGASVDISLPAPDTLVLSATTCGGTVQEIQFNLATGEVIYTHDGRRNGGGGLIWDHLPPEWERSTRGWSLVEVKTSKHDWAVPMPLLGTFGDGPSNLREYEYLEGERELGRLREKCKAAGYTLPEGLRWDVDLEAFVLDNEKWSPKFDGVHYRRAAANGVWL